MHESEELLTVAEASRRLRIHPNTTRRLIELGELPASRVGRQYRIRRESLDARLAESEHARDLVARSTAAQGLPERITDSAVLAKVATIISAGRDEAPASTGASADALTTATPPQRRGRDGS